MPVLTESALNEKIKNDPGGAFILYGAESYLVKVYTEKLMRAAVDKDLEEFNLRVFDGENTELSSVYDEVTAFSFTGGRKCVVVRDYPVDDANDADFKNIEMILQDNPEENCLIFSYTSLAPAKKMKDLLKLFDKYGYKVEFGAKQDSDIVRILENGAKKRGKTFEKGVAFNMLNTVGSNLNLLLNELEKLCAYSGDTITNTDVEAVCTKSLEASVFEMTDFILTGKIDSALSILADLFAKRESEVMILSALISKYVDMYRAKVMRGENIPYDSLGDYYKDYKGKSAYRLKKSGESAQRFSLAHIKTCLDILAGADLALKSTSADGRTVLETTLVKLWKAGA
ncbi:MAG: DNA polymerase III subunit delta [Clostridia bacterium]|nr:DNA polymerase III subunit delta [Clostridia bacterium]